MRVMPNVYLRAEVSGRFFVKKLQQKTFVLKGQAFSTPREAEQKFFGYFFSKK
jgi:hypothetical protein